MNELKDFLKTQLQNHLPGESAHLEMSPMGRGKSSEALSNANAKKVKESAVGVHLFELPNQPAKILLTQRAAYKGTHGGQISFPGGKKEIDDPTLEYTARRESFEETGLPKEMGTKLGELTEIYIPVSGFRVQPFVFYHEALPELNTDSHEVEELFFLPTKELLNDRIKKHVELEVYGGVYLNDIPSFVYNNKIIWGATAIILNELKEILKRY